MWRVDRCMSEKTSVKTMARQLDGRVIGHETNVQLRKLAKDSGLVVVYGAGDDLIEFDGAIFDEAGASMRSEHLVDGDGLLTRFDDLSDEQISEYVRRREMASSIRANWDTDGYSWTYTTDIPHETFDVMEDGDKYCRGIVFRLADLGEAS